MSSWFNYLGAISGESDYENRMMELMKQTTALTNYVIDDNNIRLLVHSYRVAKDPQYANQWPISPPEDKRYWYQSKLPDALLDHPIGDWNVSRVTNMYGLFFGWPSFNEPLNKWNVSNVTDINRMFHGCTSFNQPLNNWNVSNVINMYKTFQGCTSFNQPLNKWNVSNVTNMAGMFDGCTSFNQHLNDWNVSNVTDMNEMFQKCTAFNQPLNNWIVSNVTIMSSMFKGCTAFNQPLNKWIVSNVIYMYEMFQGCTDFNQPLNKWNVSRIEYMNSIFQGCTSFDQPLNDWNVSNVTNMYNMFNGCTSFNEPLNDWNVSNVTNMSSMFNGCTSFNQPLNDWNVSNVRNYVNFGVRQEIRPNLFLEQQAQPQPQPQGLAYEIHNVFKELDFKKFMQIIRKENNNANHFKNPDNIFEHYIRYINGTETKLIDDKKTNQKTKILEAISSPNGQIFRSLNGYLNDHLEYKDDVLEVLQFVLSQPTKYKDLYIESFENECIKAYSSTESTASCSKGVFERIFFINKSTILGMCFNEITGSTSAAASASAASASNTDCRPVYIELYNCFYPEIDINLIFKEWYDKFSFDAIPEDENPLTNLSVEQRKEHYKKFALTKEPKLNLKTLNDSITKNPNIFKTLLIDGGGRKRKSIKRKSIKRKRHRSKKNKHG